MKRRILSVDDEMTNRLIIEKALKEKFEIDSAPNAQQAIKLMEENEYDILLFDIMMPEMSGIELCQKIRKEEKWKSTPVIFLSAKDQAEDIKLGLENGGSDYMTKPFSVVELRARVETHLKLVEAHKVLIQQEKVEAVRNLMARLNHDLRNSLAIISGLLLSLKLEPGQEHKIDTIHEAIVKMTELLKKTEHIEDIKLTSYVDSITMLDL